MTKSKQPKRRDKNQTTYKKQEEVVKEWYLLDAKGKTLGRFASEIAKILRGKHKPTFTPHVDCGDGVVILNADKIYVSGSKDVQKEYHSYTGYLGGHRAIPFEVMMERHPTRILRLAVSRMLPKNKLRQKCLKRLRIFAGEEHNHKAQQLIKVNS